MDITQYWTSIKDFIEYDFLTYALLGTILLSLVCGLISPFILAKKFAFMGEGVSHSTLVGMATALAFFDYQHPLQIFIITLLTTLVLVVPLAHSTFQQKLPSDSLIGIFLTTTLGLGVLIHTLFAQNKGDLFSFLFGNILLLGRWDIFLLLFLNLLLFPLILLPLWKWVYMTYDPEGAQISGFRLKLYHYVFFFLLTTLIVSAVKIAGTVLVNTLLLIPGALALKLAKSIKQVFFISILFSLSASLFGLTLANWKNLPSGATLALTQFALFALVLLGDYLFKERKRIFSFFFLRFRE